MSIIGVDIGTTGCKALAFCLDGAILAKAYREYPLLTPHPGLAELDAELVWQSVQECIRDISRTLGHDPPQALALATLGEAVVPVDADGKPLANSLVSFDNRSRDQFQKFIEKADTDRIFEVTGLFPSPHYSLFKWMWWKEQQPELFSKTWKFLCYGDYISVRLGFKPWIDHSMATRTLAFDKNTETWSQELLSWAGMDAEKLPDAAASGTVLGELPAQTVSTLGLPRGALLVLGGLDQACAALGAGAIHAGDTLLSIGTAGVIGPVFSTATEQMRTDGILSMPHVTPGLLISLGATTGAGSVLRWYRDQFGTEERRIALETGQNVYEVITDLEGNRPTELLMLPHLSGSRFAFSDPNARGMLIGLSLATEKADLVRAILDGVAYELCLIRERFEKAGLRISSLHAVGGGSRSEIWMQIMADSMRIPILVMRNPDAGALGAALLCCVALDPSTVLSDYVDAIVQPRQVFTPRKEWFDYHTQRLAIYRQVYARIKEIYPPLD